MKNYPGKVIYILGGMREYIGEMDTLPHPNGENWYRIKNACEVIHTEIKEGKRARIVSAIDGPQKDFKKHVDIRIPEDSIMEILEVNPEGNIHKIYKQELTRVKMDRIVAPDAADIHSIMGKSQH